MISDFFCLMFYGLNKKSCTNLQLLSTQSQHIFAAFHSISTYYSCFPQNLNISAALYKISTYFRYLPQNLNISATLDKISTYSLLSTKHRRNLNLSQKFMVKNSRVQSEKSWFLDFFWIYFLFLFFYFFIFFGLNPFFWSDLF